MPLGMDYEDIPLELGGDPFEPTPLEKLQQLLQKIRSEEMRGDMQLRGSPSTALADKFPLGESETDAYRGPMDEGLAGATTLRDAEARMPSGALGPDVSQIPIDRNGAAAALSGQRASDQMFLNHGMARHLSPVGREPLTAPPDRDMAMEMLKARLGELRGDTPYNSNAPQFGKYAAGSLGGPEGRRVIAGRFEDPSGTRVIHTPDGGIKMIGSAKDEYAGRGGAMVNRSEYEQQKRAGIAAAREKQLAGGNRRREMFQKQQEQNMQPVDGLGGLSMHQAQDVPLPIMLAIAAAQRGQSGVGAEMEAYKIRALQEMIAAERDPIRQRQLKDELDRRMGIPPAPPAKSPTQLPALPGLHEMPQWYGT